MVSRPSTAESSLACSTGPCLLCGLAPGRPGPRSPRASGCVGACGCARDDIIRSRSGPPRPVEHDDDEQRCLCVEEEGQGCMRGGKSGDRHSQSRLGRPRWRQRAASPQPRELQPFRRRAPSHHASSRTCALAAPTLVCWLTRPWPRPGLLAYTASRQEQAYRKPCHHRRDPVRRRKSESAVRFKVRLASRDRR